MRPNCCYLPRSAAARKGRGAEYRTAEPAPPFCKNDNCHAKQKKRVHIRQFAGCERLGHPELATGLEDRLKDWSLYQNLVIPTLKLESKERHGAKVKKRSQSPHTPPLEPRGQNWPRSTTLERLPEITSGKQWDRLQAGTNKPPK